MQTISVALPTSVLLTPHAFYLPSSSCHESMPFLTSSSVLNGAQCPCLYAFHSSPTPKEQRRRLAARGGKSSPSVTPVVCQPPLERVPHKHHKSREKIGLAF